MADDRPPLPRRHPAGSPGELDALRQRHPRWLITFSDFADGPNYDATSLDRDDAPRLVRPTAEDLERDITAVENHTWAPVWTPDVG
jgi:hypothetical protein